MHERAKLSPNKAIAILVILPILLWSVSPAVAGAPRHGDRFMNLASSPLDRGDLSVAVPFFLRKAWTSLVPRRGGAPWVQYKPAALHKNPSVTWIGHST